MSIYGIDFGTTFSCISKLDNYGMPVIIKNIRDASDKLASVVYFESADSVVVGIDAKDMKETDGDRVVDYVKREIGKPNYYVFDGKTYTPVEISALILKRLKDMAEEQGEVVNDVVITIPVYFGYQEKHAILDACTIAGLNVLEVIPEPIAATLYYCGVRNKEEKTIMVYNLGGYTFDVTLLKMTAGEDVHQRINVLATGDSDHLGGMDWDHILYNYLEEAFCTDNGLFPEK